MENTKKITFCAIMSALAAVIMLVAYFPYFTYAVPALAGLCVMAVLIEYGIKWSILTYFCSAILTFLVAETESKIIYIAFFGFYPILKCIIEKLRVVVFEWILKLLTFNLCVVILFLVFSQLGLITFEDRGIFLFSWVLLLLGNVVFVFYDIAVSRLSEFYIYKIHPKIEKFL